MRTDLKIGYFGIPGSFTYGAAVEYFGSDAEFLSAKVFRDVFLTVQDSRVDYGVFPIENTLAGSLYENYDLLDEFSLSIVGEVTRQIDHCLLVSSVEDVQETSITSIKTVYSHPKALEQCSLFFERYPHIEKIPYSDTATAAKFVAQKQDSSIAVIASIQNAQIYGLKSIAKEVQDNQHNYTRFLIVAKERLDASKDINKCSLVIHLRHTTGSLSHVLNFLSEQNCNLTKIESRPVKEKPFEYMFYIDFLFDATNVDVDTVLAGLNVNVSKLKMLGLYQDALLSG